MNILWDKERATVKDVVAALPSPGRPAYSTVLTMLRILEEKGYARHEKQGRAFVYVPVLGRGQARRSAMPAARESAFRQFSWIPGPQCHRA